MHEEYIKGFPQVSKKLLEKNSGSIWMSILDLNASYDEVVNVLIEESYLLNTPSQIMLSFMYRYSMMGQPVYEKKILSYYLECAEEGIPRCEMLLGNTYLNGWGVKKNINKGIELLKQSELGDAYLSLAEYYYFVTKDIENSKQYYNKAEELGVHEAMYTLGVFAQEAKEYKKGRNEKFVRLNYSFLL